MSADLIRVTDDTTRLQLAVTLEAVKHRATRCVPKVGNEKCPTPWDLHHARLDELLSDWQAAQ